MAQTLSSRRQWRCELSVLLAQSATPATLSPAPCASCWPNRGRSGVMQFEVQMVNDFMLSAVAAGLPEELGKGIWTCLGFPFGGGATPTLTGGRGHFHTSLPSIPEASSPPGLRIMSLDLPTLLYLGLSLAQGSWVQEGSLPQPVITAKPGSMVPFNISVTILCQGPPDAEAYEIHRVREPSTKDTRKSLMAGNTLNIAKMEPDQTGLYRCSYRIAGHYSQLSNILRVVMTGSYDKPSLSSMNDTVVASGDHVKLQCFSSIKFEAFILTKEEAPQFTQRQSSTAQDNGQQTTFHLDRVTATQAGTYRCYGAFSKDPYVWSHPSDLLQLVVREAADNPDPTEPSRPHGLYLAQSTQAQNGNLPPPVITAQPGSMVPFNTPVTILCRGPPDAEAYEIYKVEGPRVIIPRTILDSEKTNTLSIQEMKPYWTGLYRCSYRSRGEWSPLSETVRVVMTGSYDKPSLSSMSGTVVASGDHVKLQCFSRIKFEAFILTKEDAPQFTQRQSSTAQDNGQQTTFHMDHVTSPQAGTYRCYGAFTKNPYVWSHPSDLLQLEVRGYSPPPVITAQPGSMVPFNTPVTILCRGPPDAEAYKIYKVEDPEPRDRRKLLVAGNTSTLSIQDMKPVRTGLYSCSYRSGGHWSELSNILPVVMTGSYDKPSLSSMSGTVVAPGDNVKLQCFSNTTFHAFILTKEDASQFTQRQSSIAQDNGQQTTFHLDRVTSTQAGIYRCYGAFNTDPYLWSHPSDPLQLEVRGPTGWSVSQVNQVRLSLAGLALLALVVVLAEAYYSHKRSPFRIQAALLRPMGKRGPRIMSVVLPTLLYLGLYVAQSTQAQNGSLPPPVITAQPGSMVPFYTPVTILCRGPPDAEAYEIYKVEDPEPRDRRKLLVAGKTDTLSIQEMKPDRTGLYRCSYRSGGHWSLLSDPLHVVMTGSYNKPSLSSMSGTVVAPGDNVKLQCFSSIKFEAFILGKEDAPQFTQRQSSTAQDNGQQTTFHLDRVTSTQAGTYRCYGAISSYPYVWSHPSDPLQLEVRGYLPLLPVITAQPGSIVLSKKPVTIKCRGPPDAEAYEIYKVEDPEPRDRRELLVAAKINTLSIQEMTPDRTGLYRCSYRIAGHYSQLSDPLLVVMTGEWDLGSRARRDLFAEEEPGSEIRSRKQQSLYLQEGLRDDAETHSLRAGHGGDESQSHICSRGTERHSTWTWLPLYQQLPSFSGSYDKPSLSSISGTVVAPGDYVKLQCFSRIKFEAFILRKKNAPQFTQRQSSTAQDNGQQTTFHLDRVTSTQAGTYRCYGAFNKDPYVWSHPSDPLKLEVGEPPSDPTPVEPKHPQATDHNQTQDPQGILIGFPVAIVLLLLLFLLLFFILRHRHRKAKNNVTKTKRQQATEPMNRLASEARDPQEVTYIQVAFNAPTHGTASAPSLLPRPTQASEYATVVLR
ncbi:hypothetical protein QTO34_009895 [Cnephaeus nilssonii]|uniref:Ig-like domain-containing protein n=1 Tax=Cnephaeus nilssonii TaxID=3371016 RepID=A0AA40HF68_CNENI|nr:hypothetical protein QTO34_009895 [Eptesicus nilssonii]